MNKKELITLCLILAFSLNLSIARSQPALEVEGIFKDNKTKPYAIVNGRIIKEGEEIDGVKVVEVKNDSVKFQYEGNIIVKKIGEGSGIYKEENNTSLETYKSRMQAIDEDNRRKEAYQQQYAIAKERVDAAQVRVSADKCDEYWKAARLYKSNGKYDQAIEALNQSIYYGQQVRELTTDDAYKARIDAIIQDRRTELEEVERAKEVSRR